MPTNIKTKYIIRATLRTLSPLLIGSGRDEKADTEVMLRNGKPYIPASSFTGKLQREFKKKFDVQTQEETQLNYFWGNKAGTPGEASAQSHFVVEDLLMAENQTKAIEIRDGVKIAYATGTAEEGAKYDYQCVSKGVKFYFKATITLREKFDGAIFQQIIASIQEILKTDFSIGALTGTGFGKMELVDFSVYAFEFPKDAVSWFHYLQNGSISNILDLKSEPFPFKQNKNFHLQATFQLKNTLMVGAYGIQPEEADKRHLHSQGEPILPAKSIKGAIRHRANKILNTLKIDDQNVLLYELFGTPMDSKTKRASRLKIQEVVLEGLDTHLQDRIKIDRFTGGTMDGALFNSEPLVTKLEKSFSIQFTIEDFKDEEVGLLLLLLKDLWTEDLAIGGEKNIGRGLLIGQSAELKFPHEPPIYLQKSDTGLGLTDEQQNKLEDYLTTLLNLKPETA